MCVPRLLPFNFSVYLHPGYILKFMYIYVCVCACVRLKVLPITLILFTSVSLPPPPLLTYIPYAFLDFKARPRRRARPPSPQPSRTKGAPPPPPPFISHSLSEYVKHTKAESLHQKLPELSGSLTGLPRGQMGHGCVWKAPPAPPHLVSVALHR